MDEYADVLVEDHGSLVMLRPCTDFGREWMDEHLPDDAPMLGSAVAVEPRYIDPILVGMLDDGLVLGK